MKYKRMLSSMVKENKLYMCFRGHFRMKIRNASVFLAVNLSLSHVLTGK